MQQKAQQVAEARASQWENRAKTLLSEQKGLEDRIRDVQVCASMEGQSRDAAHQAEGHAGRHPRCAGMCIKGWSQDAAEQAERPGGP
eukprot:1160477-Pelagomonas_calceolata.AAC.10